MSGSWRREAPHSDAAERCMAEKRTQQTRKKAPSSQGACGAGAQGEGDGPRRLSRRGELETAKLDFFFRKLKRRGIGGMERGQT